MTEPGAGSDLQGTHTSAVLDGDHYILNGSKTFITNGQKAGLVIVVAKTDSSAGSKGISLFLVDADLPGFSKGKNLKKLGLKENESIDHPWINKAMERAQKKVESRNFDIRKTLIKFDDVMNDQRRVIFSQRLKILKNEDVEVILEDFLIEVLNNLESAKNIYQKSNNEKHYLTSIKNTTGNALSDKELIDIAPLDRNEFVKKIKELYLSKRELRIKLVGVDENNILEKKIFLQIIDFAWRSHLQYLEQLRQVIGLRQYGQKDPLSEFKKEAFVLFEGLLEKIKNDIIKFLFNLNIVVSNDEQKKEQSKDIPFENKKVGRNEKCPCGSEKKFKHCHGST